MFYFYKTYFKLLYFFDQIKIGVKVGIRVLVGIGVEIGIMVKVGVGWGYVVRIMVGGEVDVYLVWAEGFIFKFWNNLIELESIEILDRVVN